MDINFLKNKKTKIISFILALILLFQGAHVFADSLDESPNVIIGESGISALGASGVMSPFAAGDLKIEFLEITSLPKLPDTDGDGVFDGYRYQTFIGANGSQGGEISANVLVVTEKTLLNGGSVVLDFNSEQGSYVDDSGTTQSGNYFNNFAIETPDENSMFSSVVQQPDGTFLATIKAGTAANVSSNFNVKASFDLTKFDGAVPPDKLIATMQATAYVGTETTPSASTSIFEFKSFENPIDNPITTYVPNKLGTKEDPVTIFGTDKLEFEKWGPSLPGQSYYYNKFSEQTIVSVYLPTNLTMTNISGGYTKINAVVVPANDPSGVPEGTYTVYEKSLRKDPLDETPDPSGTLGEIWRYRNDPAQGTRDHSLYGISQQSSPANGTTYDIYFTTKVRYLGDTEDTYLPVSSQHLIVDNSERSNIEPNYRHRDTAATYSAFRVIGQGTESTRSNTTSSDNYNFWTQKNTGTANANDVKQSIILDRKNGTDEKWANFTKVKAIVTRFPGNAQNPAPAWPRNFGFKYSYTIENLEDNSTRVILGRDNQGTDVVLPVNVGTANFAYTAEIPDYPLEENEIVKAVTMIPVVDLPDGMGGFIQTDGILPPKIGFGIEYKFKDWPNNTWPDGTSITPGFYITPVIFTLEYFDPVQNKQVTFTGQRAGMHDTAPITNNANYQFSGPELNITSANIDTNAQSIKPGDTVSYRIIARNINKASGNWDNPSLIIKLPSGMTLEDQNNIQIKNASGTTLGNFTVAQTTVTNGENYYRLTNSDNLSFPPSGGDAFYFDIRINTPVGTVADTYYPEVLATSNNLSQFYSANESFNTLPDGQTIADYGLSDGDNFSYFKMTSPLSLEARVATAAKSYISSSYTENSPEGWSDSTAVGAMPNETVSVRLSILNNGSVRIGNFKLYNVIPRKDYIGSSSSANVSFEDILTTLPDGAKIYYFTGTVDPRPVGRIQDVINDIARSDTNWVTTMPTNKNSIKAFFIDFAKVTILPGTEPFNLDFSLNLVGDQQQTAYNQFSFTTAPSDSTGVLIGSTSTVISPEQCFSSSVYQITYEKQDYSQEVTDWPEDVTGLFGVGPLETRDTLNVTNQSPKRPGYTFGGWFDNTSLSGSDWSGQTKSFIQNTANESDRWLKLYSKWDIDSTKTVNVTFNFNGGKNGSNTSYTENTYVEQTLDKASVASQPTKGGYTFGGWYKDAAFTESLKWEPTSKISSADIAANGFTLYAKWDTDPSQKATFKFDLDKTTHPQVTGTAADQSKAIGEKVTEPTGVDLPGYTLIGWKNGTAWWDFDTEITSAHFDAAPITLKAVWEIADGTTTTGPNGSVTKPDSKINVVFKHNNGTTDVTTVSDKHVEDTVTAPSVTYPGYKLMVGNEWTDEVTSANWGGAITASHYAAALTDGQGNNYFEVSANWEVDTTKEVAVTFDLRGGKIGSSTTNITESKSAEQTLAQAQVANNPSKSGYTFTGWYRDTGLTPSLEWKPETTVSSADIASGTLTLYAGWAKDNTKTVKVKFDLNNADAQGTAAEQTLTVEEFITEPTGITLPGYYLDGWKYNGNFWNFTTNEITSAEISASTITLVAQWHIADGTVSPGPDGGNRTDETITVVADFDGGKDSSSNTSKTYSNVHAGDSIATPSVTKTGYTLVPGKEWVDQVTNLAWVTSSTVKPAHFINGGLTIKANWQANTYKLKFKNTGATTNGTLVDTNVVYDGLVPTLPDSDTPGAPKKTGYKIAGWTIDGTSTEMMAGAVYQTASDTYLEPIWTPKSYFVILNNNYGTTPTVNKLPLNYDDSIASLPNAPARPGYTFKGWANTATSSVTYLPGASYTHITDGDKTLYAVWEAKVYTVTFNKNGGEVDSTPATMSITYNTNIGSLPGVSSGIAPVKKGYTFKGWSVSASAITPDFLEGSTFSIDAPSGMLNVYAVWEINTYKITVQPQTYNYNQTVANVKNYGQPKVYNIKYGESFTATVPSITGYEYRPSESTASKINKVEADATINLVYKEYTYVLNADFDATKAIDLDVNDKYPAHTVNKPTLAEFVDKIGLKTVPQTLSRASIVIGDPVITSPQYEALNFDIVNEQIQPVDIIVTWPSGQTLTKTVGVKILDQKVPVVTLTENKFFTIQLGIVTSKKIDITQEQILQEAKKSGLNILDNYDGEILTTFSYPEGDFSKIVWKLDNEYALYVDAKDANGNKIATQALSFTLKGWDFSDITDGGNGSGDNGSGGSGGKDKPDVNTPNNPNIPGGSNNNNGGGSGNGNVPNGPTGNGNIPGTGGGSGNGNNNGSNNNNDRYPDGSYIDDNGNLVDKNGNTLVSSKDVPKGASINSEGQLIDAKGNVISLNNGNILSRLPRTGSMVVISVVPIITLIAIVFFFVKRKASKYL